MGLPGEEIEILGSQTIIYNQEFPLGAKLLENYLGQSVVDIQNNNCRQKLPNCHFPKVKIPPNHYFLLGDNRIAGSDSRELGTFPEYSILGQESFQFFPFDKVKFFAIPEYKLTPNE